MNTEASPGTSAAITPDMLDRAWRMGYLAGCSDPTQEHIVRANLTAGETTPASVRA